MCDKIYLGPLYKSEPCTAVVLSREIKTAGWDARRAIRKGLFICTGLFQAFLLPRAFSCTSRKAAPPNWKALTSHL